MGLLWAVPHLMNPERVEDVVAFALSERSEADDQWDRELGPIHLLKYVYLTDMLSVMASGESYTGAAWRFHNFGPWSQPVHAEIERAVGVIGAEARTYTWGEEGQTGTSYCLPKDTDYRRRLPLRLGLELRRCVREFGKDTEDLLHFVYQTPPMRFARPGGPLDLQHARSQEEPVAQTPDPEPLTVRQAKKRKERLQAGKERVRAAMARAREQRAKRRAEFRAPVYDEEYLDGVRWLDELGGDPPEEGEGDLIIDESVWEEPRGDRLP